MQLVTEVTPACLDVELRSGFIHKIDGLVGEESVCDVPMTELSGRHERGVLQSDSMMHFVAFFQATEDAHL